MACFFFSSAASLPFPFRSCIRFLRSEAVLPFHLQSHVSFLRSAVCLRFLFQRFVPPVRFNEDFFRLQPRVVSILATAGCFPFWFSRNVADLGTEECKKNKPFWASEAMLAVLGFSRLLAFQLPPHVSFLATAPCQWFNHRRFVRIWAFRRLSPFGLSEGCCGLITVGCWNLGQSEECRLLEAVFRGMLAVLVQKPLLPFQTQKIVVFCRQSIIVVLPF